MLNQFILRGEPESGRAWNLAVGSISTLIVVAGVVLGVVGLGTGLRRKTFDTSAIALVGLLLNLGILFVIFWGLYVLSAAHGG